MDRDSIVLNYRDFILGLYGAEFISGFKYIHGKKGDNALVVVHDVDVVVGLQDCINAIKECGKSGYKELHILGWEYEFGLSKKIRDIAKHIVLKLRIIPREVMEKEAVRKGDIRFYELAHFDVKIDVNEKNVEIQLLDFVIEHLDYIPDKIKEKIKKWSDWIDYWSIDFDFNGLVFHTDWTSYRTKQDRHLLLKARYRYNDSGKRRIAVKVIDIFSIETIQVYDIEVK